MQMNGRIDGEIIHMCLIIEGIFILGENITLDNQNQNLSYR